MADAERTPGATDVLVVGSGVAGCSAALAAAREGADVTVVTKAERPDGAATHRAQGGVAVARDDPESLRRDVVAASHGTADGGAVDVLVAEADDAVRDVLIETLEVPFDVRDAEGGGEDGETFDYAREAAHGDDRILHVDAATGQHVLPPFLRHLDDLDGVTIREDAMALDLITHEGCVRGAAVAADGDVAPVVAGATVLATGGIGAIYPRSTNPAGATGDGVAMAALAGADIADMEYVQFHPTVYAGDDPFLLSEALRGEGAVLRNADGDRFMPDVHEDAELAPRDVVARAVARERDRTGVVTLDLDGVTFEDDFPGLAAHCRDRGVDWRDGVPVAPAEHFLCGGVAVDADGHTSLPGLYAAGECARTGVHGANRLASTSLLEGLVWGRRAGRDAAGADPQPAEVSFAPPRDDDPPLSPGFAEEKLARLRRVAGEALGLERKAEGLERALGALRRLKGEVDAYTRTRTSRELYELRNAVVTALLVARAARRNERSVGCHHRLDAGDGDAPADAVPRPEESP